MPKTIKPDPLAPIFRWNAKAGRYVAPNGRFVPFSAMRRELRDVMAGIKAEIDVVTEALINREITVATFQREMMVLSKDVNLAGGALERGGFNVMTPSDFGKVGAKVKGEYAYIDRMAAQIESGEQRLDGTLRNRTRLYGKQGDVTYQEFARETAKERGLTEERSNLNPGESCDECIGEDSKGWVPIGTLIPIGARTCLSNCNCGMSYRNLTTGETRMT